MSNKIKTYTCSHDCDGQLLNTIDDFECTLAAFRENLLQDIKDTDPGGTITVEFKVSEHTQEELNNMPEYH